MKKIICYGDSNTFGYNPTDGTRYGKNTRWTALLQNNLGKEYMVINEGACDRTGFVSNPKGFLYSAQQHFPEMISRADNVYLLILAIGTNDLQFQYNITTVDVEKGLDKLIKRAKDKINHIIIIPPIILSEKVLEGFFNFQFDVTSVLNSKDIGKTFEHIANKYGCFFFDINKYTYPSDTDGLHYDENAHKLIADKLSDFIKKMS